METSAYYYARKREVSSKIMLILYPDNDGSGKGVLVRHEFSTSDQAVNLWRPADAPREAVTQL